MPDSLFLSLIFLGLEEGRKEGSEEGRWGGKGGSDEGAMEKKFIATQAAQALEWKFLSLSFEPTPVL